MIRNFLRIQHTWLDNWRAKKKKKKGVHAERTAKDKSKGTRMRLPW